jgi:hypothetical protein
MGYTLENYNATSKALAASPFATIGDDTIKEALSAAHAIS